MATTHTARPSHRCVDRETYTMFHRHAKACIQTQGFGGGLCVRCRLGCY
jgi:hypothetical protein